jgi:hypothetical protein
MTGPTPQIKRVMQLFAEPLADFFFFLDISQNMPYSKIPNEEFLFKPLTSILFIKKKKKRAVAFGNIKS